MSSEYVAGRSSAASTSSRSGRFVRSRTKPTPIVAYPTVLSSTSSACRCRMPRRRTRRDLALVLGDKLLGVAVGADLRLRAASISAATSPAVRRRSRTGPRPLSRRRGRRAVVETAPGTSHDPRAHLQPSRRQASNRRGLFWKRPAGTSRRNVARPDREAVARPQERRARHRAVLAVGARARHAETCRLALVTKELHLLAGFGEDPRLLLRVPLLVLVVGVPELLEGAEVLAAVVDAALAVVRGVGRASRTTES